MKKTVFMAVALLAPALAFATTDHYVLRNGNHVFHMQITQIKGVITVKADVEFEPNANEPNTKPCSAQVSGEAKKTGDNELVMKNHIESRTDYCNLNIKLTPTGAVIDQSQHCDYYAAGLCHFSSDGKELVKFQ